MADYERICSVSAKIARGSEAVLRIGCLRGYNGRELPKALEVFAAKYPDVELETTHGNHEELYYQLRVENRSIGV
ncbi:MAG: hypothetical protein LIP11_00585 [Clostridiales bacterium]|nr:hypothetical protein [Clostridiales bacterium]